MKSQCSISLTRSNPTSEGLDRIPFWFLRLTAASIARPLTYLINLAFLNSVVPKQWKTSIISPRPKIPQPKTCADYRPISITPILSRLLEKQICENVFVSNSLPSKYFLLLSRSICISAHGFHNCVSDFPNTQPHLSPAT